MRSDRERLEAWTDADLLSTLVNTNDEESKDLVCEELWSRWWPHLNDYLARRFPDVGVHFLEDAVATTLNTLLLDPSAYEPSRGDLGPYVRTIAYRQVLDRLKAAGNRVSIDAVATPVRSNEEDEGAFVQKYGFAGIIALRVLDEMKEADRATVRLWARGYRHAEIGEYIGATADAVRVRLHRIRKRIRDATEGWI